MKAAERDAAMQQFRTGQAQLLVATTVVEVGVDVPEASIIVIEHAERFGLLNCTSYAAGWAAAQPKAVVCLSISRH